MLKLIYLWKKISGTDIYHFPSSRQFILAQADGVPVGRRSGGRLATTRPFLIEGVHRSKKLFRKSWQERPENLGVDAFQDPPSCHFGFCRRCCVVGGERVPLAPLSWYYVKNDKILIQAGAELCQAQFSLSWQCSYIHTEIIIKCFECKP